MLTDLACASVQSEQGKERNYILTADRDEHIRVSRGIPQTYIIEGFCLGHKSFVSKICILSSDLLVSGGGDDELYVWDWQYGRLLFKLDLRRAVDDFWETQPKHSRHDAKTEQLKKDEEELRLQNSREAMGAAAIKDNITAVVDGKTLNGATANSIAVSGLWAQEPNSSSVTFYCALEGVPAVFRLTSSKADSTTAENWSLKTTPLPGNPLDVAILADGTAIVAIDNVHEAGSTQLTRFMDSVSLA